MKHLISAGLIAISLAITPTTRAADNSWTNSSNGKWEDAANWSLGATPATAQAVFLTNDLSKTITIDADTTNAPVTLTVSNLTVAAPLAATNTLSLKDAGVLMPLIVLSNVNINGGGVITLSNAKLQSNGRSGSRFTVDGILTLDNDSSLAVTGRIEVGRAGNGILTFNSGTVLAQVGLFLGESPSVTGTVFVSGGQMIINGANGSQFGTGGGVGQITVSNGTLQIVNPVIGRSTNAESALTLVGGTTTISAFFAVGYDADAGGTVWVTGGQLNISNITTEVGDRGIGQMIVSNGTVLAQTMYIGRYGGSRATLNVLGGVLSASSSLIVGSGDCVSTVNVLLASGRLSVSNAAHNATLSIQSGTFTQSGGTLTVDNLVINNACARFIHTGGALSITTTNLNPNQSAVGDGIPNGWKQQYGLDLFDPSLAGADPDGDGQSNLLEYLAGTDPTNSAVAFKILGVVATNEDVRVTWQTAGGRTNVVQSASDLSGTYANIGPNIVISGTGDTATNYLDTGAATNATARFYRIRLVP
jgi:hypothetical protein